MWQEPKLDYFWVERHFEEVLKLTRMSLRWASFVAGEDCTVKEGGGHLSLAWLCSNANHHFYAKISYLSDTAGLIPIIPWIYSWWEHLTFLCAGWIETSNSLQTSNLLSSFPINWHLVSPVLALQCQLCLMPPCLTPWCRWCRCQNDAGCQWWLMILMPTWVTGRREAPEYNATLPTQDPLGGESIRTGGKLWIRRKNYVYKCLHEMTKV